jgi:voltage-gated potassium channel
VTYWFAPLGQHLHTSVIARLLVALVVLAVVTALQLVGIFRSSYPEIRAIESVGITLPLALLPFAATYYTMSHTVAGSFDTALTKLDAMYFTFTTFATVGYGDIAPKSQAARAVVMGQMAVDLVVIGLIAKAIFAMAKRRRDSLERTETED